MTIPEHVIEAATEALANCDSPLFEDRAEAALEAAFASLWQPIESVELPDHEPALLWQEGWMLSPMVVGWRVTGHWLCDAYDIDSENQKPTHAIPLSAIPLPKGSE